MSELCAWDLDGTIRPGTLLGDAIQHGAEQGFIDLSVYADPRVPTYAEVDYFVAALERQSLRSFTQLTDRLTDEAPQVAFPWAMEELQQQGGDRHAVIFSHSPGFLVRAFARGLPNVRRGRGSYFHTKDLVFSGRATTLSKTRALRRYAREHTLDIGFAAGDSQADVPMLLAAKRGVVVNPSDELAELAGERGWKVQITS